jgi:hypothetical protein
MRDEQKLSIGVNRPMIWRNSDAAGSTSFRVRKQKKKQAKFLYLLLSSTRQPQHLKTIGACRESSDLIL